LQLNERAEAYNKSFDKYPPLLYHKSKKGREWIYGVWIIGNNYQSKNSFYGEYPPNYLKRINSMFYDIEEKQTLHLFSGSLNKDNTNEITFDINEKLNPSVVGDAHKLSEYFKKNSIDLIIADPPYSEEDANKYGIPMVKRNTVVKECYKILKKGGFLVWLDQVYPQYKKEQLKLIGSIGVIRSTNHRTRTVFIWRKEKR